MPSIDTLAQAYARKRKKRPPGSLGDGSSGQYFIPGIGEVGREKNKRAYLRAHPYKSGDPYKVPDGSWHSPHRPRRGRTRPTPGSLANRNPTWN